MSRVSPPTMRLPMANGSIRTPGRGRKEEERIFLNCLSRFPRAVEEILSINMPPQDRAPVKDTDLGSM
ncbi:hypothetical protein MUK42_17448 [Musa troglodytarum]|uniref:Uncharacterized protein n=1 Tax=Musa troglodytarum TaxID=320322 RepID=A0A9E7GXV7_9LILI|nr:hypothetical protein MUK42_17448 [Musa troglodytarum]